MLWKCFPRARTPFPPKTAHLARTRPIFGRGLICVHWPGLLLSTRGYISSVFPMKFNCCLADRNVIQYGSIERGLSTAKTHLLPLHPSVYAFHMEHRMFCYVVVKVSNFTFNLDCPKLQQVGCLKGEIQLFLWHLFSQLIISNVYYMLAT